MAARLEGAKDYLVSVAERTFGIDAYKRWQDYLENPDNISPTITFAGYRKIDGIIVGLLQVFFPAGTDYITKTSELADNPDPSNNNDRFFMARYGVARLAAEGITWIGIMPAIAHNTLEFAIYKVGVNIVTHVGLDLLEAGISRIPRFRPPAATLAA